MLNRHSRIHSSVGDNSGNHDPALDKQHSLVRRESEKSIEQRQVIDGKEYFVGFLFINL